MRSFYLWSMALCLVFSLPMIPDKRRWQDWLWWLLLGVFPVLNTLMVSVTGLNIIHEVFFEESV